MTLRDRDILIAQLFAARAQIDATLAVLDVPIEADTERDLEAAEICTHPTEQRSDLTTMGGPDGWRCRSCGYSTLDTPLTEES